MQLPGDPQAVQPISSPQPMLLGQFFRGSQMRDEALIFAGYVLGRESGFGGAAGLALIAAGLLGERILTSSAEAIDNYRLGRPVLRAFSGVINDFTAVTAGVAVSVATDAQINGHNPFDGTQRLNNAYTNGVPEIMAAVGAGLLTIPVMNMFMRSCARGTTAVASGLTVAANSATAALNTAVGRLAAARNNPPGGPSGASMV